MNLCFHLLLLFILHHCSASAINHEWGRIYWIGVLALAFSCTRFHLIFSECSRQLSSSAFFSKNGLHYCAEDYQRLFGTRCHTCGKYVEGEVVTALGNTYHQECFHCAKCG